ncbi:MAG: hypothetical protein QXO15_01060 [Nitrososphaerota archaeon]
MGKHEFGIAEPDYLPPTKGWLSFTENVAATHESGGCNFFAQKFDELFRFLDP